MHEIKRVQKYINKIKRKWWVIIKKIKMIQINLRNQNKKILQIQWVGRNTEQLMIYNKVQCILIKNNNIIIE